MKLTKISQFSKISNILSTDLFLISRSVSNNETDIYASYSIDYTGLSNLFVGYFSNYSLSVQGEWKFKEESVRNYLTVHTMPQLSSVINYTYAKDHYLSLLSALFKQLYGSDPPNRTGNMSNMKLPSYVGYMVISENITTESTLQGIFGTGTRWKKIGGRILLGVGSNEKNTDSSYGSMEAGVIRFTNKKMGGSNESTINDLPSHSHSFEGVKFGTYPPKMFGFTLHTDFIIELVVPSNTHPRLKHHHSCGSYIVKGSKPEPDVMLGGKRESKSFSYKIRGEVMDNVSQQLPHENMPPYKAYYIWERTE